MESELPRPDTNFRNAINIALGDTNQCCLTLTIENEYVLQPQLNYSEIRIGFTESAVDRAEVRDTRWIKPDALFKFKGKNDDDRYIFKAYPAASGLVNIL